jgi:hypothetical protein
MKIDRHKYVRVAYHGFTPISSRTRKDIYSRFFNQVPSFTEKEVSVSYCSYHITSDGRLLIFCIHIILPKLRVVCQYGYIVPIRRCIAVCYLC